MGFVCCHGNGSIKKDPHSTAILYGFDGFPSWHGGEFGI